MLAPWGGEGESHDVACGILRILADSCGFLKGGILAGAWETLHYFTGWIRWGLMTSWEEGDSLLLSGGILEGGCHVVSGRHVQLTSCRAGGPLISFN